MRRRVAPIVTGLLFLLAWQVYVTGALPDFVARPSGIIAAIPSTLADIEFWHAMLLTVSSIVEGVAIGSALGLLVGLAMGRVRALSWFLSVYIRALYSLPLIALVPLIILLVGYQPAARLIVVAISAFLPVAVTVADGTRAVPKEYLEVGRIFGARLRHLWLGIALPSAMPHIVTGIELGFARGITNAIAVEVLASIPGMGMSVFEKSAELNEDASFVYVLALAVFAVSVRVLMIRSRRQLTPWYSG
ncbi:MAG: ABC transporter permease subunit [Pseudomonadota bacterium]|nr:ABC transporter permease subunit [Pseudomonadota bacterium]